MPIAPWMMTSYSQSPTGGNPGLLLGAGQLREQTRSNMANEDIQYGNLALNQDRLSFGRYQEDIRQRELRDQQLNEAHQRLIQAHLSNDPSGQTYWSGRLNSLGGQVTPGVPPPEAPPPGAGSPAGMLAQDKAVRDVTAAPAEAPPAPVTPADAAATETELATQGRQARIDDVVNRPPQTAPTVEEGNAMLESMRRSEAEGLAATQKKAQSATQAANLVKQASVLDQRGDAKGATAAMAQALALAPDPRGHLELGKRLEAQGDRTGAAKQYLAATQMDATNEVAMAAQQEAAQRVTALGAPAADPAAGPTSMQAPPKPTSLPGDFTVTINGKQYAYTADMMNQRRVAQLGALWEPIKQTAWHPVLRQMASEAQAIGAELVRAGVSPKDAFAASNAQYSERSRVWASIQSAQMQAHAKAVSQGDGLANEKWNRKQRYVDQISDNLQIPKHQLALAHLETQQKSFNNEGAKNRAAAWKTLVREFEGGRATDKDYYQIVGAGSLYERFYGYVMGIKGEPTEEQMREANAMFGALQGALKSYVYANVRPRVAMFVNDESNRELYGDDLPGSEWDMSASLLGPLMPKNVNRPARRSGGQPPQRSQTRVSESSRTSTSGPPTSDLDEESALGALAP